MDMNWFNVAFWVEFNGGILKISPSFRFVRHNVNRKGGDRIEVGRFYLTKKGWRGRI